LILQSDHIFDEERRGFTKGEIFIEGDRFTVGAFGERLDYRDAYVLPGFIDLHTHGAFGRAYMEIPAEEIDEMALHIAASGISAFCPATVRGAEGPCKRGMDEAARSRAYCGGGDFQGARLIGIYQEGPFLSPQKPGVADVDEFRKPDVEFFKRLCAYAQEKDGPEIKFVVIAPELEGALNFIREVSKTAVCTMAHTVTNYATAKAAIENGAGQITHLFNAMPPLLHREPGLIGAAFDSEKVMAELITDGEHVHSTMVRAAFKLFGEDRIILISDSLFSGLPDGVYTAAGLTVELRNGIARNGQGALAGAAKNLGQCVINAVKNIGIPLYSAVKCASINPAIQAGVFDERGSIQPGKIADLVILNEDYTIRDVIIRGNLLRRN
jgi:N-acetylglucosamine-6-phosphate deacetylase